MEYWILLNSVVKFIVGQSYTYLLSIKLFPIRQFKIAIREFLKRYFPFPY